MVKAEEINTLDENEMIINNDVDNCADNEENMPVIPEISDENKPIIENIDEIISEDIIPEEPSNEEKSEEKTDTPSIIEEPSKDLIEETITPINEPISEKVEETTEANYQTNNEENKTPETIGDSYNVPVIEEMQNTYTEPITPVVPSTEYKEETPKNSSIPKKVIRKKAVITKTYNKTSEEKGKIIVNYKNKQGNNIAKSKTIRGTIGSSYSVAPKTINNYYLVNVEGEEKATFTKNAKNITYIYDNSASIIIKYTDEDGEKILPDINQKGIINETYKTNIRKINGYELVKEPENKAGVFKEEEQTITYVYKKINTDTLGNIEIKNNSIPLITKTRNKRIKRTKVLNIIPPESGLDDYKYHIVTLLIILIVLLGFKMKYED